MNTDTVVYNKDNPIGIVNFILTMKKDFKLIAKRNPKIDGRMGCGAGWDICLKSGGKAYRTKYNNSKVVGQNPPNPNDLIDCLINDAWCYLESRDFYDFCLEFGYDKYDNEIAKKARKVYESCKHAAERMTAIFTEEEMTLINEKLWN